jgi:hypothetical protein
VIPVAFVLGLLFGGWWTVVVSVVGWPVAVTVFGSCDLGCAWQAALIAGANATVGAVLHRSLRALRSG